MGLDAAELVQPLEALVVITVVLYNMASGTLEEVGELDSINHSHLSLLPDVCILYDLCCNPKHFRASPTILWLVHVILADTDR